METAAIFQQVFGNLYGIPCWGAKRDQDASLTIEFGTPHFAIHNLDVPENPSLQTLLDLAKQAVYVRGDWHLSIHSSSWKILSRNRRVLVSSTSAPGRNPASYLNGHKLVRFSIHPQKAESTFVFGSGRILKTWISRKTECQWWIREPWGKVLELRGDKRYCYHCAWQTIRPSDWKPIQAA